MRLLRLQIIETILRALGAVAMRTTWEELGIDLAERDWIAVGQMDDREITTSLGKRLLMVRRI